MISLISLPAKPLYLCLYIYNYLHIYSVSIIPTYMYSADLFLSLLPRTHFVGLSAAYMHICSVSIIINTYMYMYSADSFLSLLPRTHFVGLPAAYMHICRLMRRRIKVADPRIYLVSAAYMHIREEVVDEYHNIGSQRPAAKRTRRFACLEETQNGGFAWLVVANRALPYRSSHSSPKRTVAGIYPTRYTGRPLVVGSAQVV